MRSLASLPSRIVRSLALMLLGAALLVPSQALASGESVWADCGDNAKVDARHSPADFADALKNPPADAAEYTDCLDVIRQAQIKQSQAPSTGGGGGVPGGGGNGSSTGGGSAVAPDDLSSALAKGGVNPAAPATGADPVAPAPVTVDGERIDLESGRVPSIASALSLPLPLAASAVVVLLSAGLPLARYVVARFGGPPTGTTTTP